MSTHDSPNDEHIDQFQHDPKRPYSIDLTLELERQLDRDDESIPPTPAPAPSERPQSLDQHVLASIVMQLRHSLAEVSRERDDLLKLVSDSHLREADFKDTLQQMSEKCTQMEDALDHAKQKMKDDEDAIAMLRTKVEESRRGLMRLQTENRRMSTGPMTIDMSRAGIPSFGGPTSNKRASFTPLTGSRPSAHGHRRISSISDPGLKTPDMNIREQPSTPNSQALTIPDNTQMHPPVTSRRFSGLFRGSPPQLDLLPAEDPLLEVQSLKRELKSVKDELEETRHELTESNEAREASETCVNALRDFIAENNVGVRLAGLEAVPSLPSIGKGDDSDAKKSNGGWGFKLWKAEVPQKALNSASVGPLLVEPLSKKLGEFFSSRASISSTVSSTLAPTHIDTRDSYIESDTSSIVEPISPTSDLATRVVVRDDVRILSSSELVDSHEPMKRGPEQVMVENNNMIS